MNRAQMVGRRGALATFTAVGALLIGLSAAQAQSTQEAQATGAPGAGSFPGSLLVPGTNTSLKIGGYAKLDVQYDATATQLFQANGAGSGMVVSGLPLDDNIPGTTPTASAAVGATAHSTHGTTRLTAAESRFNIETRTPTPYGELKTFIEGDFEGVSGVTPANTFQFETNRTAFALRHAYGTLGPLLAGQYFSLFEDVAAIIETLDFGGSSGAAGVARQPQVRYVYNVGNGLTIAGSMENPQTMVGTTVVAGTGAGFATNAANVNGTSTFGLGQGDKIPDFVAAVIFGQSRGHIAFRAVARDLYDHGSGDTGSAAVPASANALGWGAGISGDFHTFGKDDLVWQANGGFGIGRYTSAQGVSPPDSIISADGRTLKPVHQWGAMLGYQHWWTDSLRSNIEGGVVKATFPTNLFAAAQSAPTGALGSLNNRLISGHLNLIWSPVPPVDLGVEEVYGQRKTVAGQRGDLIRTQFSAKFKF